MNYKRSVDFFLFYLVWQSPVIDVSQVFDRFYKADEARSKTSSGLGLSIVKELVLRVDGKIWDRIEWQEFCVEIGASPGNK